MSKFKRKFKKADAILSADIHIRPDTPICRTDDFFSAMNKKLDFILALSKEHGCPLLVAGDIGNRPLNNGWPVWLLKWVISKFQGHDIISIAGQHDLENHKLDRWDKSGIGVLHASNAIGFIQEPTWRDNVLIFPFSYGQEITNPDKNELINIAMTHQMIVEKVDLFPDQNAIRGHEILKKHPGYNLILSGDNHAPFVAEYEGRKLVNPGSMMRSTTAQIDHKPRVYLWFADTNEVEAVYLPIEKNVISREHIKDKESRDNRNEAFIKRVNSDIEIQLSFENNLENYFKKFRTEKVVVDKTWAHVK